MGLRTTAITLAAAFAGVLFSAVVNDVPVPFAFTETPRYERDAWLAGHDRFPAGATLKTVGRSLVPSFYASADPAVSFDATHLLFSGKRTRIDHWQVWEVAVAGGEPRQVISIDADCIHPLYLPDDRIVYTRVTPSESDIEVAPLAGGNPERLTFTPDRVLADDVLQDGRILFESGSDLLTVYPDGTGVESYRCDHGSAHREARQIASGDLVFHGDSRLARFTSALAVAADIAQPGREAAGPVAEIASGDWLLSLRPETGYYGLYRWKADSRQTSAIEIPANANAIQPAIVQPRAVPKRFPSALVPARTAGNLLCLNANLSKENMHGKVHKVRFYTTGSDRRAIQLGETAVENDGSFYVQVPADRPLRIEAVDANGRVIRAEHSWFWMRPSEQRICVGCHTGPEISPENKVPEILQKTIVPVHIPGDAK